MPVKWPGGQLASGFERAGSNDRTRDAPGLSFLAIVIEDVGDGGFGGAIEEIGRAFAFLAHSHVERAVSRKGKAATGLVELHRGHADVHHYPVNPRNSGLCEAFDHFGKAARVEDQARRLGPGFSPFATGGDGIGIAVEGVNGRPGIEQLAGITTGTKGGVNHHTTGTRRKGREHFIEQNRHMRSGGGHLRPFPLRA